MISFASELQPAGTRLLQRHRLLLFAGFALAIALSRWLFRARVPDDYDSINFLLGMSQRYDLAEFQPHFPGYPVYVALGAALCRLGMAPLAAATALSSAASGVAAFSLALCAERLDGLGAAISVLALQLFAWLPWLIGSGALSDSLGLALAALALALLLQERPRFAAAGFVAGLLLGTRVSYWPLLLPMALLALRQPRLRTARYRFAVGFAGGLVIWALPFFEVVGVRNFVRLGTTHLAGHFGAWGGSVATRPDLLQRGLAMARGIFFDGLAPAVWPLTAIVLVLLWAAARAHRPHRTVRTGGSRFRTGTVLWALAPYAAWVFFAQNVIEQPRHLLPLVAGGLLLLGCWLASHPLSVASICLLSAFASVPLAFDRRRTAPAGAQAAEWVAQHEVPETTTIVATRSSRYFQALGAPWTVREHSWLSEELVELSRVDRFPSAILLTSEVDLHSGGGPNSPLPAPWRVEAGPQFCRDPRIDRREACLGLSRLVWSVP